MIHRGRVSQYPGRLVMLWTRARVLARSDRPRLIGWTKGEKAANCELRRVVVVAAGRLQLLRVGLRWEGFSVTGARVRDQGAPAARCSRSDRNRAASVLLTC